MTKSSAEFAETVMRLAQPQEPFQPTATYDPDGDCIEFLVQPDPFYAERIDDLVTVYYSQETQEVIGSLIKGVGRFCREILEKIPGFRIEIRDGKVSLEHIFLARLWTWTREPDEMIVLAYRKLIRAAAETNAEAEMVGV